MQPVMPDVPSALGSEPLLNAKHEKFCWAFVKVMHPGKAYMEISGAGTNPQVARNRARILVKRREVVARIRWLLDQESKDELTKNQITKRSIELGLWEVAERSLQHKKVDTPKELRGQDAMLCPACAETTPEAWCEACVHNQKLVRDWQEFGGTYRFDAKGAIPALIALGKERGMFIERKLVGTLEGDELIDSMTDEEVRNLVRSLAGEVGLRVVESGSESSSGAKASTSSDVQSVSETSGVPPTRH